MNQGTGTKKNPDVYLCTGKAAFLAVMKLIEALAGCYALYYVAMNPHVIRGIVENLYEGLSFSVSEDSAFYTAYQILPDTIQVVLACELLLIVLDGFAAFFTRAAHRGAGLVRFCHTVRFIFSAAGFLVSAVVICQYILAMNKAAQALNRIGISDSSGFPGLFELILYIICILGAFLLLMAYDLSVSRAMKQVAREINDGAIQRMKKKSRLRCVSACLGILLAASTGLSAAELAGGAETLAAAAAYVRPMELLYKGSGMISIGVTAFLAILLFLVNRCAADFVHAHS